MPITPRLICGEALAELRKLDTASVDALITDPPYSSGGMFRGDRAQDPGDKYEQSGTINRRRSFDGDVKDQMSWVMWCQTWLAECRRVMRPGAPFCVFVDWRQLPALTFAVQLADLVWRGVVSWDKGPASRCPGPGRFRHQCEFIVWGSNGPMPHRHDVGVLAGSHTVPDALEPMEAADLARAFGLATPVDLMPGEEPTPAAEQLPGGYTVPVRQDDKHHITGKPTELLRRIVKITSPGGVVMDPFMGSGTTGVAAQELGFGFVGIERDPHHWRTAHRRIFRPHATR